MKAKVDPIESAAAGLDASSFHGVARQPMRFPPGGMPRMNMARMNPIPLPPGHSFAGEGPLSRKIGGITVSTALGAGTGVFVFLKGMGVLASVGTGVGVAFGLGYLATKFNK